MPQIIDDNLSKSLSEGKEDSEINIYINQYQMNKRNSLLGSKRKDYNKKCTTDIIQIINKPRYNLNHIQSKEREINKNNDVWENNKLSESKLNREDVIIEMINVLIQTLLYIKIICVKTLNNILKIVKSLNLPIKIRDE